MLLQKQEKEKKNTDVNSTISWQRQEVLFLEKAIYRRLQLYRKKKNMTILQIKLSFYMKLI